MRSSQNGRELKEFLQFQYVKGNCVKLLLWDQQKITRTERSLANSDESEPLPDIIETVAMMRVDITARMKVFSNLGGVTTLYQELNRAQGVKAKDQTDRQKSIRKRESCPKSEANSEELEAALGPNSRKKSAAKKTIDRCLNKTKVGQFVELLRKKK